MRFRLFWLLLITSLSYGVEPIDFVIDLDWTLFYQVHDPEQVKDLSQLVQVDGQKYRVTDHATDFIEHLTKIPGARITFFSGGNASRNRQLLEHLRLPDGRTGASFKILNDVDLSPAQVSGAAFANRFKKDLMKVAPEVNLDRAVLIDDNLGMSLAGQERNLLLLDPSFDFIENYSDFRNAQSSQRLLQLKYVPHSRENWALERRKLERATGLIDEALSRSADGSVSFRDALHALQFSADGYRIYPFSREQRKYYDSGRVLLSPHEIDWRCFRSRLNTALK